MLDANGYVKLEPMRTKPYKEEKSTGDSKQLIDYCLNCKKKKCSGNCDEIKSLKRRIKNETKSRNN